MELKTVQAIRDAIVESAYTRQVNRDAPLETNLQSEIGETLEGVEPWHNLAVGYSFANERPDSARLELRVPAQSRKSFSAARRIQNAIGLDHVNVKIYRRPLLNNGVFTNAINLKREPLHLGTSIGSAYSTGTLGGFCADGDGNIHLLSCSHVLCGLPGQKRARKGEPIFQPGPRDKAPTNDNEIAKLSNFTVLSDAWAIESDSGHAELDGAVRNTGNIVPRCVSAPPDLAVRFAGKPILGPPAELQLAAVREVYKVGKMSGLTEGELVVHGGRSFSIECPDEDGKLMRLRYNNLMEIAWKDGDKFSIPGDSGSVVFCEVDGHLHALGIIIAGGATKPPDGTKFEGTSFAGEMTKALDIHGLEWVTDGNV